MCKQVQKGEYEEVQYWRCKGNEGYVRAGGMMRKGEIAGIWGRVGMRLGTVDEES